VSSTASASPSLIARNGSRLTVRRLALHDAAALQRFNARLSSATRGVFLPHAYDDASLVRYLERARSGQDRAYVVVDDNEEVAGYAFLWEFDHAVPLLGIGFADAWQGQGLGEPMLRRLIEDAREAGRRGIELTTAVTNERALRLYLRLGFSLVGEVDNVAGDGRVVRERRLFLALQPGAHPLQRTFKPPV